MWRFYAAATLLVAVFVFVVTLRKASPPDLRIAARASGTPSAARSEAAGGKGGQPVRGDAPWALSALPDCARQHLEVRDSVARVRAKIPADAMPVEGELVAGPCSIRVAANGIFIVRGDDRLRIPPPARLLHAGKRYYLYSENRNRAELRVYSFTNGP